MCNKLLRLICVPVPTSGMRDVMWN